MELNYSKKQMQPLINKFQINPETNKLFINICEMFSDKPNYQIWAVKAIFSKILTFDELLKIHNWANKNQGNIKFLKKGNITSYTTQPSIESLMIEMQGIDNMMLIKDTCSIFNTDQRKILLKRLLVEDHLKYVTSTQLVDVVKLFKRFSKLPMARKKNVCVLTSSMRNYYDIMGQINIAINATYTWDKEDMLAFMENNTQDCEVIFNQGPIVILRIANFEASKKLCGGGRTQWCITKEAHYFNDYSGSYDNKEQYFYFDFSRKETDCFAHIGFTIENGNKVIYAQSCDNRDMRNNAIQQGQETHTFSTILAKNGIKMCIFKRLRNKPLYAWDILEAIKIIKANPSDLAIAYESDKRIIVNVLTPNGFNKIANHSFITHNSIPINSNSKGYLLMDFNLEVNDEKAIIGMLYKKDQYGTLSLNAAYDTYGGVIDKKYFNTIGISQDLYIGQEKIDPRVLLHKYIDENDELAAIKLIEKEGNGFDINYPFDNRRPIFSAISCRMYDLFEKIVSHPKWDSGVRDGFGLSLLQALIYIDQTISLSSDKQEIKVTNRLIKTLIEKSKTLDYNATDNSGDTALSIACQDQFTNWVVKALVEKQEVNVNTENGAKITPVGYCIMSDNLSALQILGQRPDLKLTANDLKLAKEKKINLDEYIKPNTNMFKDTERANVEVLEEVLVTT
jgi:hypothetical protein